MGADITYTCIGGNQYQVTLTLYRDCAGTTVGTFPQTVNIASSCGNVSASLDWVSTTNVSQVCPTQTTTCNGGSLPGTEQYIFTGIVTLPPCNNWVMSWSLCCRNDGISNLVTPGSQDLYIETTLNSVLAPCNNSPQFLALPTPYLCPNQLTMYNHGASDVDGDSLYYQFTTPLDGPGAPIGFTGGYSQANPIITTAGMNLNPQTGEMCFTPSVTQICVVAVKIFEYRNNVLIGTYIREMQVVVSSSCSNTAPYAGMAPSCGNTGGMVITYAGPTVTQIDSNSLSMCPFDSLCFQISFLDPDGNNVTVNSNAATSIPGASFTIVNNGTTNPIGYFCWVPTPLDSGINVLTIHLMDDACPISANQYYTYDITVFDQPYAGPDQIICGPQWAQLNASGGAGYSWSVLSGSPLNPGVNITCNPCSNPQVKPTVTTTYLLTSTLTAACINTDTITITVVPDYFVIPFGDTTLCDYLSTPIGVNVVPNAGTYTYSWSPTSTLNNSSISNPSASPTATTTYVATITSPFGCVKKDSVTVNVNPPPTLTIRPGDTTVCQGSPLNFDLQSTCTYTLNMADSWGDGWNGQTISVYDNGNLVGTYTVATGFSNSVTFPITNGNTITLVYGTGSFQNESSFTLVNGQGTNQFSVAAGGMSGWINGNTYYTGVGNCGPTLSNYTFNWSPSAGLSSTTIQNPVATPLTTTTYTVTLTDVGGCTVNRSQTITVVPNYTLNSTQTDTTVCLGETVLFTATPTPAGVYNYSWTPASIMDNPNSSTPTATFTTPGLNTIIVNVDNGGGCLKSDTMFVTVSPAYAPNINIVNNDTSLSCNGSVLINLDLGGGIPVTCGPSASTACSGPTTPRTVGTATGANSSTSYPAPYGNWYRNAKHQFLYTAAELNALGFNGGKITQIGWQVTTINGTTSYNSYTIKMKCTNITNLTATWQTGLTQVFNPKTVNIVTGYNMHTLDVAYEWDGISNLIVEICYDNLATSYTNNSITPWATTSFTSSYWYRDDSTPACPTTSNSGNSTNRPVTRFTTCPTTPNPAAFNYSWTPTTGVSDPTIQNPVLSPGSTTTYTVTVTDPVGGCFDTDSINIIVNSQLTATFLTTPSTCNTSNDGQIIATGSSLNPPFTFEFYDSTGVTLLQTNIKPLSDTLNNISSGTYLVSITDAAGCGFDTLITLTPTAGVYLSNVSNDTTVCINQPVNLTATGTGGTGTISLIWDNGLVGNGPHSVTPLTNTTYTVFAQDAMGCTSLTDTINITVNPDATILLTSSAGTDMQTLCINTPIINITYTIGGGGTGGTVTGLPTGVTGTFNAGVFTITGTPSETGVFNYIVTTTGTCAQVADTGTIIITPDATISLTSAVGTNTQTLCVNTALTSITYAIGGGGSGAIITGLPTGVTGSYNAGVFTISGNPSDTGVFNYIVTTTGTCTQTSDSGTITVTPNATLVLSSAIGTDAQTLCINTPITNITYAITGASSSTTVIGLPIGVTGALSSGTFTISGLPSDTGVFNYIITTTGICTQVSDTGTITITPDATISLTSAVGTNAQTVCINSAITPITYAIGGGGTGATISGLPTGVTSSYNAGVLTISGTPTTIGTSNYTITTTGTCVQTTANGTITLNDNIFTSALILGRDTICPNDTTRITINPATGGSGVGYTYNWFDSNNNPVGTGLSIIVSPTISPETYTVVVGDNCSTPTVTQSITVYWFSMPQPSFIPFNTDSCYGFTTSFINTTAMTPNINSVLWSFGDGGTSNNILTVDHYYSSPGCFDVTLSITSDLGCVLDTNMKDLVCARDYPIADFTMSPQPTDITDPIIQFSNQSFGNVSNYWTITGGYPNSSTDVNPISEFPSDSAGVYDVQLFIENSYGCRDSILKIVKIDGLYLFYIPNSFTPNGDFRNETFKPMGDGIDTEHYLFMIFDRWGEKLFETDDLNEGWDGTYKGNFVASGVYIWKVKAKELYRNVKTEHTGHVNLMR
jgi:gliding motility-associated-like protein